MNNKFSSNIILNHRVYYVFSPEDDSVLLALDIKISNDLIKWFDTVKERIMYIDEIFDDNPKHFVFKLKDKNNIGVYTFLPITLKIYEEKVKNKILIPQNFSNEELMLRSFEETKENAW